AAVEQGQDVGVLQAGDDPDLAQEAIGAEGGADLRAEDLEGDLTLVAKVAGAVDTRHAPLADQAEDLIAIAEGGPKSGEKVVLETAIAGLSASRSARSPARRPRCKSAAGGRSSAPCRSSFPPIAPAIRGCGPGRRGP